MLHLDLSDGINSHLLQISQRGMQAKNAGQIRRAGLKPIGHKIGHHFLMRGAARASGQQGPHVRNKIILDDETADALRAQQALMSGKGQGVDIPRGKIHRENTGRLCGIQNKTNAMLFAQFAHFFGRHQCTANIGSMQHHHRFGVGTEHALQLVQAKASVGIAGDALQKHAILLQLHQGTHHSIMLHGRGQHMISGTQKALQQYVQRCRNAGIQHHILCLRRIEQTA